MKAYLVNELVKMVRYPYTVVLVVFSGLISWVLIKGFSHDALETFQLWHQMNPKKSFEEFMFGSLKQQLNLLLFLSIALLTTVSFYVDGQARFFARHLTLPVQYVQFLLAKLTSIWLLAAVQLLLVSFVFHPYIIDFESYFTRKIYGYGALLQDFGTRLILFTPLILLVMLLILLTRLRMIAALLLALVIFYAARLGWLPFGGIHQLSLLTEKITFTDLILPTLIWSIILFSLTKRLLQSNSY